MQFAEFTWTDDDPETSRHDIESVEFFAESKLDANGEVLRTSVITVTVVHCDGTRRELALDERQGCIVAQSMPEYFCDAADAAGVEWLVREMDLAFLGD